jgi:methylenetetrahydrofolate dehydrogenase (NADP+)/methenyltetrahydrofolate cyclohydrolase
LDTVIIDGKAMADRIVAEVASGVVRFQNGRGRPPCLAVVRVGDDPASAVYVRTKIRQSGVAGIRSVEHALPAETTQAELLDIVARLNDDDLVDGILVQLPLPPHLDSARVLDAVRPDKDVDGFHIVNAGRLVSGLSGPVPCTPLGCLLMLRSLRPVSSGLHAVVIGRSNIVGKPMASLLLREDCTVTIAHSRTRDLPAIAREADILVAAVGRPEMVRGDWIKPGAVVFDVGINRIATTDGKNRLVGDVAFTEAIGVAGWITPVPGGVGPMTVACLLRNTLQAADERAPHA